MAVADEIRREVLLPASRQRVWEAITRAEELSRWFGTGASVELRPGGRIAFEWAQFDDEAPGEVEVVDEPNRFVFRWHPFGHMRDVDVDPALRTRVEFTLEDHPDGTLLTVSETGFASLPEAIAARAREDNVGGWKTELQELHDYLAGS